MPEAKLTNCFEEGGPAANYCSVQMELEKGYETTIPVVKRIGPPAGKSS
jgi:hypothetical protein